MARGELRGQARRRGALFGSVVFGLLFVLLSVAVGLSVGIGTSSPAIPPGAVAVVEEVPPGLGTITAAELDQEVLQMANFEGMKDRPGPGDEGYDQLADRALESLIVAVWLQGQAEELGISIDPRRVGKQLRIGGETESLKAANYTRKTIEERVRLNLATEEIMKRLGERAPEPTEEEIQLFYEEEPFGEKESLAQARSDIEAELEEQKKQEVYSEVDLSFPVEWQARTHCSQDFDLEQCSGSPAFGHSSRVPEACFEEDPAEPVTGCPAPIAGRAVAFPGTIRLWRPQGKQWFQGPIPPAGGEGEVAG